MHPMCHTRWTVKIHYVAGIDQKLSIHRRCIFSVRMTLWNLLALDMATSDNEQNKIGPKKIEGEFHFSRKYHTSQKKITSPCNLLHSSP